MKTKTKPKQQQQQQQQIVSIGIIQFILQPDFHGLKVLRWFFIPDRRMELIVNLPFYLGTRLCKILPWKMLSKKHIRHGQLQFKHLRYINILVNTQKESNIVMQILKQIQIVSSPKKPENRKEIWEKYKSRREDEFFFIFIFSLLAIMIRHCLQKVQFRNLCLNKVVGFWYF